MLHEITIARPPENDLRKRWFQDDYFDLFIWFDAHDTIQSVQLCYDRLRNEHTFTWRREYGFQHARIEDGESSPVRNRAPLMVMNGPFPLENVRQRFLASCPTLEPGLSPFVVQLLDQYAGAPTPTHPQGDSR